jgi:hypothetical protein
VQACLNCGIEITPEVRQSGHRHKGHKHLRYCSVKCRSEFWRKKWQAVNSERPALPSATVGAIHEYVVGIDLLRRGWPVFRSLSPACHCDLAVVAGGELLLVEVTTGFRTIAGALSWPTKRASYVFDVLAVVEKNGQITYIPELPGPAEALPVAEAA